MQMKGGFLCYLIFQLFNYFLFVSSLNGLNMALGLYSSSLCGVVVLTPSIQAQANKDIIKNANMSTEFHFSQVSLYF